MQCQRWNSRLCHAKSIMRPFDHLPISLALLSLLFWDLIHCPPHSLFFLFTGPVNSDLFLRHVPGWLRPLLCPLAWLVLRAPRGGAQTPLYCALQEGIEPLSGRYFANCHVEEVSPAARDDRAAHRLWEASKKLAGLETGEETEMDEDSEPEDTGSSSSLRIPHSEEPTVSESHHTPTLTKVTHRNVTKAEPEPQSS